MISKYKHKLFRHVRWAVISDDRPDHWAEIYLTRRQARSRRNGHRVRGTHDAERIARVLVSEIHKPKPSPKKKVKRER